MTISDTQLFVVGHADIHEEVRETSKVQHAFGGLVEGLSEDQAIRYGVDYGRRQLQITGHVGRRNADCVILAPVSANSAQLFMNYLSGVRELKIRKRFPFYFSRDVSVLSQEEIENVPSQDLYGRIDDQPELSRTFSGQSLQSGLRRARANCITLFSFFTRLSGVDLSRLDKDWYQIKRSAHFGTLCSRLFEDAAAAAGEKDGITVKTLKLEDGGLAVIARTPKSSAPDYIFEQRPAYKIIAAAASVFGGYEALKECFGHASLFETAPLPPPAYLSSELAQLEFNEIA